MSLHDYSRKELLELLDRWNRIGTEPESLPDAIMDAYKQVQRCKALADVESEAWALLCEAGKLLRRAGEASVAAIHVHGIEAEEIPCAGCGRALSDDPDEGWGGFCDHCA